MGSGDSGKKVTEKYIHYVGRGGEGGCYRKKLYIAFPFLSFSGFSKARKLRELFELIGRATRVINYPLIKLIIAALYWQDQKPGKPCQ